MKAAVIIVMTRLVCLLSFLLATTTAFAQQAEPAKLALTPQIGVTSESRLVDGRVIFSNGDTDYLLIEPSAGLLVGVELAYRFQPKLSGVFGLSYAMANARYIERNNLRPDIDVNTLRFQPGVMVSLVSSGQFDLAVGGGLTIARISVDNMYWKDRYAGSDLLAVGLFGAAGIDVGLGSRLAFHSHLMLEGSKPAYGDLEDSVARADGEAASSVPHDVRGALILAVGLSILF